MQQVPSGADDQVLFVHTDHLGAAATLTDAQANVAWAADRLPFGRVAINTAQLDMPLRFPGQYYDDESGLHYNYFRDYDPTTGRYIQSDPIGLAGGLNTYAYAGGNPLTRIDPTGEAFFAIPFFAGAGGGSASTAVGGEFLGLGLLGAWGAYNEGAGDMPSDVPSSQPEQCEDDDRCEELGKRAKGQAKRVNEHVLNEHFHSKPCINLSQTLSTAKAIGCNLTTPNFSYAITVVQTHQDFLHHMRSHKDHRMNSTDWVIPSC